MAVPEPSHPFAASLARVCRGRKTGVLTVTFGEVQTRIYLLSGVPVFASEGVLGDAIGRLLLEQGLLDDAKYTEVLHYMIEHEVGQFAEVAARLGYLSQTDVDQVLREQVRRKILHCMDWAEPRSEMVESQGALDDVPHYPVDPEGILVETARKLWGPPETERILSGLGSRYPALRGEVDDVARSAELKAGERRLVELLDGSRTLDGVITVCPLDQLHALQIVAALAALDEIPDGARFNLVFFHSDVLPWSRKLVTMDERVRERARSEVLRQDARNGTNLHAGLRYAFQDPDVDTIVLLSDGEPSEGVLRTSRILADVREWNDLRGVVVHCVAMGWSGELLESIASEAGGDFLEVR